jgi:hypothetical protein
MSDPTTRIIDEYLNLPMGEALLLHRVIGRVLERMGDGGIAAATVVRPRKLAGIHVARSVPETDPAAESASVTSPRRRRRRTRAEMTEATIPAVADSVYTGELLSNTGPSDPTEG